MMKAIWCIAWTSVLLVFGDLRAAAPEAKPAARAHSPAPLSPADLGRLIFFDTSLSASGRMACATCHDPGHAHAQTNDLAMQLGGANLDIEGLRSVPSLRYLNLNIPFHYNQEGKPVGGFSRDGRAQTLVEQAEKPFLEPREMANKDGAAVVDKLKLAPYAESFRQLFGKTVLDNADFAFFAARFAIGEFEQLPEFHPYDSKYDLYLAGKAKLSAREMRGLSLFNDALKGNCVACHPSARNADGSPPRFTDDTYDNLGVPRNNHILANTDPKYTDMGLCGPLRTDISAQRDLCGAFRVPTLRNVATRRVFFHNGMYRTLLEAVRFYFRRDTHPQEWYPSGADGKLRKFDDLPAELAQNVNIDEVPYDRKPGQAPRMNEREIGDLVAFLGTLTDGYDAKTKTADPARSLAAKK
jgi:cytochrome c peroxidase